MTSLLVPAGLAILMVAVGLETRLDAFRALARAPRAVALGVVAEIVGLPLLAALLARGFALPPVHAIGLILVAAAPAGVTSNFVTLMARGDVALSVVLTVATSAAAPLVVPAVVGLAFSGFADRTVAVDLPFAPTFGAMAAVTVLPLLLGAGLAHRFPARAEAWRSIARRVSKLTFAVIVAAAIVAQGAALVPASLAVGPAALVFDVAILLALLALARLAGLSAERAAALAITGVLRNVAVALTVAVTLLDRPDLAAAATVHVVTMNAVALAYVALRARGAFGANRARDLSDVKDG